MNADNSSTLAPFSYDELNGHDPLFLAELDEPSANSIRLVIREGRTSAGPEALQVAGTDLGEGFRVVIDESCASITLEWTGYVLYQVLKESFGKPSGEGEPYEGKLARKYSVSKLLRYVVDTTHATDEYPGKLLHFQVLCEDHVLDVISVTPPLCLKSGRRPKFH